MHSIAKAQNIDTSSLILKSDYYAHYHLSAKSSSSKDNSITNFMIDETIKYLIKNNCKYLHLGGGRSNQKNDSLLKFKKNFSLYQIVPALLLEVAKDRFS